MRMGTVCVALLMLGLVSGCGKTKLQTDANFELPMEGKPFEIDPIKSEQKIKVTGTATGAKVNVFVFLKKDEASAEKEIMSLKFTPIILAKQEKTEAINLEATIPANETAVVRVTRAGAKASVQLKITN
jgi:hypothetical protein